MYIKKSFLVILVVTILFVILGIYYGYKMISFSRSLLIYKDKIDMLYNIDLISDKPTIMVSREEVLKKVLSEDELRKIVFYLTRINGEAKIPNREFDLRIAFPHNDIDIYFIDEDNAIIWAKMPGSEYKFSLRHYGIRSAFEKIQKNNASN